MKIENIIRRVLREQQEEEKLLKIPSLKFFNNDWNVLQMFLESQGNPRYSIGGYLNLRYTKIETLGNLVRVEGYLNLFGNKNLQSLGDLEYVSSDLELRDTDVETLGNLVKVDGILDLTSCKNLQSLGNLEYVGALDLQECLNLKSLGKLKHVGRWLDLRGAKLKSFGDLEYVGGSLDISRTNIESLGNLEYVGGNLDLRRTPLSEKYTEEEIRNMVEVVGKIFINK
jgi:hypothetical protein